MKLEDCDFYCACDSTIIRCGDRGDDCGCTDTPTCWDCHAFHWPQVYDVPEAS